MAEKIPKTKHHKVYYGNYDGVHHATIAAKSKQEAIEALGTSEYCFDLYYIETGWEPAVKIAMSKPGTVFLNTISGPICWFEDTRD